MELPSNLQINEEIEFRPMYRHQQEMGIADDEMEGKIIAVRFTEAKVFYDVYSPYWGRIFDNVDSIKCRRDAPVSVPVPAEN